MNDQFFADYRGAKNRLLLLDYDGTLTPIVRRPEDAAPSAELRELLQNIARPVNTTCVIISGRPHDTLEEWLGDLPLGFVAEHGVCRKLPGQEWALSGELAFDWKSSVRDMMAAWLERLPGSFVEEKHAALAFHYREASRATAEADAARLFDELQKFSSYGKDFELIHGKKVIEAVTAGVDKGAAAEWWLKRDDYDFVCAIGDDTTDEAMFLAMPPHAHTIHVGEQKTAARTRFANQLEVIELLEHVLD